jgi:hypothetical protein
MDDTLYYAYTYNDDSSGKQKLGICKFEKMGTLMACKDKYDYLLELAKRE